MDFTSILAVFSTTIIIAAIGAVAAIKVLPGFTKWGYEKVASMFNDSYGFPGESDEEWNARMEKKYGARW